MINLLSYDSKKQIRAARLNVILFRYIVILGFSAVFLILACTTTYYFINNNKTVSSDDPNKASLLKKQIEDIQLNFGTARSILDQQVSYSDLLIGIASSLPTGTRLESISLNDSSFGVPTDLKISAKSSNVETEIQDSFNKSPQMFSGYNLKSTEANSSPSADYPYVITISIVINKAAFQ